MEATPDEFMRLAQRRIEASLARDLPERAHKAPPDFFERMVVNLLLAMDHGGSVIDADRPLGRSDDDGDGVIDRRLTDGDRCVVFALAQADRISMDFSKNWMRGQDLNL